MDYIVTFNAHLLIAVGAPYFSYIGFAFFSVHFSYINYVRWRSSRFEMVTSLKLNEFLNVCFPKYTSQNM
jgi:hypothetical protein